MRIDSYTCRHDEGVFCRPVVAIGMSNVYRQRDPIALFQEFGQNGHQLKIPQWIKIPLVT